MNEETVERLNCLEKVKQIEAIHLGLRFPHVSLDTPLVELEYYLRLAKKKNLISYLRQEISSLVSRGAVLCNNFDYQKCEDETKLIVEKNQMAEELERKNILKGVATMSEHMFTKFISPSSNRAT